MPIVLYLSIISHQGKGRLVASSCCRPSLVESVCSEINKYILYIHVPSIECAGKSLKKVYQFCPRKCKLYKK